MTNNSVKRQGGVFYLNTESSLLLNNVVIEDNSSEVDGGVGYVLNDAFVEIIDSRMVRNLSESRASVLYFNKSKKYGSKLKNCLIRENSVGLIGSIILFDADLIIEQTIFE